jgi:hypothetical protein
MKKSYLYIAFIDGSKFRANASIKHTWIDKRCKEYFEKISKNIDRLVDEAERIDQQEEGACSDSGYFSLEDLKQVEEDITVVMPTQKQAQKENNIHSVKPFGKEQFQYDSIKDEYVCPEGKRLLYRGVAFSDPRKRAYKADGKDCRGCPHFGVCTQCRDGRRIIRMAEEPLKENLEAIYHRPEGQEIYRLRKQKFCNILFFEKSRGDIKKQG